MQIKTVAILGGSGFVGRHLCDALINAGFWVRVLTRDEYGHRSLTVYPELTLIEVDVFNAKALSAALQGVDAVINLVGILNEKGHKGEGFHRAHVLLTQRVVAACHECGVKRLLHMSALGASPTAASFYQKTKGLAQAFVLNQESKDFKVTVFRPSIIFGPGDNFFNRFAQLLKLTPIFMLPCYKTLYAPVYVGDVVQCMVQSLKKYQTFGKSYDLCGPKIYSLKSLILYIVKCLHKKRLIIGLNKPLSYLMASILEYFPGKPFSKDNYLSASTDNVSKDNFPEIFNIKPCALENIVPKYINTNPYTDHFSQVREHNATLRDQ